MHGGKRLRRYGDFNVQFASPIFERRDRSTVRTSTVG
jgi:hypothetical protein